MNINIRKNIIAFLFKNIIVLVVFFICNLFFIQNAFAVILTLKTENNTRHQQEQFFVDVFLLPDKNENVNAFDVSLSYSSNLTFIGSNDGSSIVNLWVEKPNVKTGGTVNFSGIIPGGFSGLVNPMNLDPINNQKPGLLTELIFVGNSEGTSFVNFNKQTTLANDGLGTTLETKIDNLIINIDKKIIPSTIDLNDIISPEPFSITLSQDPALFDGKYTIIFEAKDKGTGINYYEVKEEGTDWQKAESPYPTIHQPPIGTIFVKAVDYNGNSTVEEITPNVSGKEIPLYSKLLATVFVLIVITLIIFFIRFIKRKIHRVI